MSLRFECEINALKERGIMLNDLLPQEVEDLVEAVRRLRNPFSEVNFDAMGEPLYKSNGLTLYPLTIGAIVWLEEFAKKWWKFQPMAYFWAVVYALINGRDKNTFVELRSEVEAYNRIRDCALSLAVCEAELTEAIDAALDYNRPPRKKNTTADETGTDWSLVVATMEAKTGIEAEKWIWGKSVDYVTRAYQVLIDFATTQGGGRAARMKDEADHALNHLARVRASIIERITKERAAENESGS